MFATLLALLLSLSPSQFAKGPPPKAVAALAKPWTVTVAAKVRASTVEVRGEDGGLWGSGFAVRPDLVVTCAHVVDDVKVVQLVTAGGTKIVADVVLCNRAADLAFLRLRGELRLAQLELATTDPEIGEEVLVTGHPFALSWSVSRGIVSAIGRKAKLSGHAYTGLVQTDAAANPGSSGGALVNRRGVVLGVVCGGIGPGVNLAVGAAAVRRLLPRP